MFDNVNGFVPNSHANGHEPADSNGISASQGAHKPTLAHYSPVSGLTGGPAAEPGSHDGTPGAESAETEPTSAAEPASVAAVPASPTVVVGDDSPSAGQVLTELEVEAVSTAVHAETDPEPVLATAPAATGESLAPDDDGSALEPVLTIEPEALHDAATGDPAVSEGDAPGAPVTETVDGVVPLAEAPVAQSEDEIVASIGAEAIDPDPSQPLPVGRPPSPIELDAQIESLLFVADGPAPVGKLAEALEVKVSEVEAALVLLEERYQGRGIAIQRIKDRVQLTTAPTAAVLIQRFLGLSATAPLSKAALETLAIIAYRQPITRPQIEQVRGVNSDSVIKNLLTKGLVEEAGIAEGPGRPVLYITTSEFLQHFGLSALTDLPALNLDDVRRSFASEILKG